MTTNDPRDTPTKGSRGRACDRYSPESWRGFVDTLTAVVDLAVERDRQERETAEAPGQGDGARIFRFLPMAAATEIEPPLPTEDCALKDVTRTMDMWVEKEEAAESGDAPNLLVHIQACGAAAIKKISERWATVTIGGEDPIIVTVQFDKIGYAAFKLQDVPDFRAALTEPVLVDVPGDTFRLQRGADDDERP